MIPIYSQSVGVNDDNNEQVVSSIANDGMNTTEQPYDELMEITAEVGAHVTLSLTSTGGGEGSTQKIVASRPVTPEAREIGIPILYVMNLFFTAEKGASVELIKNNEMMVQSIIWILSFQKKQ